MKEVIFQLHGRHLLENNLYGCIARGGSPCQGDILLLLLGGVGGSALEETNPSS